MWRVRHLENIVDRQGEDLRQDEEQVRQQIGFEVIRQIQSRVAPQPSQPGRLYVCLDGILQFCSLGSLWVSGVCSSR